MNKVFQLIPVVGLLLLLCHTTLRAQVTRDTPNNSTAKKASFSSHLWYGGGLGLGFSSTVYESIFQIGISPMVGYKIFEEFSIGPRVSINYAHYRSKFTGDVQTANPVSWTAGVFTRYKIFRPIFLHAEWELENSPVFSTGVNGNIDVLRVERTNAYIGAGYNSGDRLGFEIMILYNVLQPDNDLRQPFVYRGGITYNF